LTIDGQRLGSRELQGRRTLLEFITLHEAASQLVAKQGEDFLHQSTPRINVIGVIMEGSEYQQLAPAFREGVGISYPLVMADTWLLGGHSPYGEIDFLPLTLVLDENAAETERFLGPPSEAQLSEALARALR
jgi:hypothetical protein